MVRTERVGPISVPYRGITVEVYHLSDLAREHFVIIRKSAPTIAVGTGGGARRLRVV